MTLFNSTAKAPVSIQLHGLAHGTGWWRWSSSIPSQWNTGHSFFSCQKNVYWIHFKTFHWLFLVVLRTGPFYFSKGHSLTGTCDHQAHPALPCIGKFQPTKSHTQYLSPLTKGALMSRVFFCLLAFPSLQYSSASTLSRTLA